VFHKYALLEALKKTRSIMSINKDSLALFITLMQRTESHPVVSAMKEELLTHRYPCVLKGIGGYYSN
jgi:hypothetical protein